MALVWKGTRDELKRVLRSIPGVLAGSAPDPWGIHGLFWGYVGNAALREIREAYLDKIQGDTGSDGIRWAKLAVATLAIRRRKGRNDDQILLETGRILASLRPGDGEFPRDDPDQVFRIEWDGVIVGTSEPKADRHQKGTEHMPARPIVPPDGKVPAAWRDALLRAMDEAMRVIIEVVVSRP